MRCLGTGASLGFAGAPLTALPDTPAAADRPAAGTNLAALEAARPRARPLVQVRNRPRSRRGSDSGNPMPSPVPRRAPLRRAFRRVARGSHGDAITPRPLSESHFAGCEPRKPGGDDQVPRQNSSAVIARPKVTVVPTRATNSVTPSAPFALFDQSCVIPIPVKGTAPNG